MNWNEINRAMTRRQFFGRSARGIGTVALASLLNPQLFGNVSDPLRTKGALARLEFAPKAKRVIYLFQSGAPSHLDLFDPKPKLKELTKTELPNSIRMGQRITGMTSGQKQLLVVGSPFKYAAHGKSGMQISELLPWTAKVADDIRSEEHTSELQSPCNLVCR